MNLAELLEGTSMTAEQKARLQVIHQRKHEIEAERRAILTGPFGDLFHTCKPFDRTEPWPGDCAPCGMRLQEITYPGRAGECDHG